LCLGVDKGQIPWVQDWSLLLKHHWSGYSPGSLTLDPLWFHCAITNQVGRKEYWSRNFKNWKMTLDVYPELNAEGFAPSFAIILH